MSNITLFKNTVLNLLKTKKWFWILCLTYSIGSYFISRLVLWFCFTLLGMSVQVILLTVVQIYLAIIIIKATYRAIKNKYSIKIILINTVAFLFLCIVFWGITYTTNRIIIKVIPQELRELNLNHCMKEFENTLGIIGVLSSDGELNESVLENTEINFSDEHEDHEIINQSDTK